MAGGDYQIKGTNLVGAPAFVYVRLSNSVESSNLEETMGDFAQSCRKIVFDIDEVRLFSSMIRDLVRVHEILTEKWGKEEATIYLVNVSEPNRRVLEVTQLDSLFQIMDSVEQAIAQAAR